MPRDEEQETTDPVVARADTPPADWATHVMIKMLESQETRSRGQDDRDAEALRLFAYVTLASLGLTALVVALLLGSDLRMRANHQGVEVGTGGGTGQAQPAPAP